MRDEGIGFPAAVVLLSPSTDLTQQGDTYVTLKSHDPTLISEELKPLSAAYADPAA